jgi:hypothetical protein
MKVAAQIHALTEGFVLDLGESTIACTTVNSLTAAIKKALATPDNIRPFTPRPSRGEVKAALTGTPAPAENPFVPPPPAPPVPHHGPASPSELAADQVQNLYKLADACYRGQLQTADIRPNLEKYVPAMTHEQWNLFYSEYVADRRGMDEAD